MFVAGGETLPANIRGRASMAMNWILPNIPLGVAMVTFAVGLPAFVMWKFPDGDDNVTAQPAALNSREHTAFAARSTYEQAASAA